MNSNGIITAPVSIDDVKTVLGVASNDLAVLCSSPKINMWAKYKPVPLNKNFNSDEWDQANNFWKNDAVWWKGENFEDTSICGMKVGVAADNTAAALINLYDGNLNGWAQKLPSGGASEPFRLSDFIGYNHNAVTPFGGHLSGFAVYNTDKSAYKIQCGMSYVNTTSNTEFYLTDLGVLGESYFGCLVVDSNGSVAATINATSPLKDAGFTAINDAVSTVTAKQTYKIVPFLLNIRTVTVPFLSPIEITIPDKISTPSSSTGGDGTEINISITAIFVSTTSIAVTVNGPTTSDCVVTLKTGGTTVDTHTFGEIAKGNSDTFEFFGVNSAKIYTVYYAYKDRQGTISVIRTSGSSNID